MVSSHVLHLLIQNIMTFSREINIVQFQYRLIEIDWGVKIGQPVTGWPSLTRDWETTLRSCLLVISSVAAAKVWSEGASILRGGSWEVQVRLRLEINLALLGCQGDKTSGKRSILSHKCSTCMWTAGILRHIHTSQNSDISPVVWVRDLSLMLVHVDAHVPPSTPRALCTAAALRHNAHIQSMFTSLTPSSPFHFIALIPPSAFQSVEYGYFSWEYHWQRGNSEVFLCVCCFCRASCELTRFSVGVDVLKLSSVLPIIHVCECVCV